MGTKRGIEGKPDVVGVLHLLFVFLLGTVVVVVLVRDVLVRDVIQKRFQLLLTAVIPRQSYDCGS